MARMEDAREVEKIVYSYWREHYPLEVTHDFHTRKQGYTWVVTFRHGILDEKGEVHVNARTGKVTRIN